MGLATKILRHELAEFSPGSFLHYRCSGIRISRPPVFIVGCGHSGTTVLRHILGRHPDIYAVPYESRIFFRSPVKIRIANFIWSCMAISQGKTRWLEKTPAHINRLDRILKYYPEAKVLLLIRDGRDVSLSLFKRWGDFERSVRRWVQNNKAGEAFWTHPRVMKLYYEKLVSDFENQINAVCDFIGEPCDPAVLNFSQDDAGEYSKSEIIGSARVRPRDLRDNQIKSGLYDATGRWAEQMSAKEKGIFKKMAGKMLIAYGYAEDLDW